jgi:exodeoxyribonuclease VII large subunit
MSDTPYFRPPQRCEKPYTVSQINEGIAALLESAGTLVWVEGEISNFKRASSGHCYLVLKDAQSQIPAVLWKSTAAKHAFEPQDGMAVTVIASLRVYRRGGYYQLDIQRMQPSGTGALFAVFEKLKKKLEKEGLFDPQRKKPLPETVSFLGVITARTGAVFHDICWIVASRAPQTNILLRSVPVQGEQAPPEIVAAITEMNEQGKVDCIILARGGGSIEDLWAFNDERVVRAIAASKIPLISAIGHEIDFTLSDFAADLRAPTPSAAAEIAVPDTFETTRYYEELAKRFASGFQYYLTTVFETFRNIISDKTFKLPLRLIEESRQRLDMLQDKNLRITGFLFQTLRSRLSKTAAQLHALSPLAVLARGYSVVSDEKGKPVKHADTVTVGDSVSIRFHNGGARANITEVVFPHKE